MLVQPHPAGAALVAIEEGRPGIAFPLSPASGNLVGRRAPGRAAPAVDLGNDRSVSRRHARLFRSEAAWWIEDLGGAAGTRLDGRRLVAGHPERLVAGSALHFAAHEMVFIPAGVLHARTAGLDIVAEATPVVALSALLARSDPLRRCRVRNCTDALRKATRLGFQLGSVWTAEAHVPNLDPGEVRDLGRPIARSSPENWWHLRSPVDMTVTVNDSSEPEITTEMRPDRLRVLPWDHWIHGADQGLSLVPFVLPGNDLVARIAAEIAVDVQVDASHDVTAEAVFRHLAHEWTIAYRHEPGGGDAVAQRVRLPHEVFLDPIGRRGYGTCLDLAIATAAILEALGARPLVAIIDLPEGRHALVGCRAEARTETAVGMPVASEEAVWFDPNGITRDPSWGCDFTTACSRGRKALRAGSLFTAVDVAAARAVGVQALPAPGRTRWTDEATEVVRTAAALSAERGCRLTTAVLLAALLMQLEVRHPAHVRQTGLLGAGARLGERLRPSQRSGNDSLNYRTVLARAEVMAATRTAAVVDVPILATALLAAPSEALDQALAFVGTERNTFRAILIALDRDGSRAEDETSQF